MPIEQIEIRKYAYTQYPAVGANGNVTGIINLHDATGKHIANLLFVRDGMLPAPVQDDVGLIFIHLWENAFPVVIDMLRNGTQVFVFWDGSTGSIGTAIQSTG